MPIQLGRVVIRRGENLFISVGGSTECSLFIQVDQDGTCVLSGPMNERAKRFRISIEGIEEMSAGEPTIHGLYQGVALCGFLPGVPATWPPDHVCTPYTDISHITCAMCRARAGDIVESVAGE